MDPARAAKKRNFVDLTNDLSDEDIDPRTVQRPRLLVPNNLRNQFNPQQTRPNNQHIIAPVPTRPYVMASVLKVPASSRTNTGSGAPEPLPSHQRPQPLHQPAKPAVPARTGSFPSQRGPQLPQWPARPAQPVKVPGHNYQGNPVVTQATGSGARTLQPGPSNLNATPSANPRLTSARATPQTQVKYPMKYPMKYPNEFQAVEVPRHTVQGKNVLPRTSQRSGTGVTPGQQATKDGARRFQPFGPVPVARKAVSPLSRPAENALAKANNVAINTVSISANHVSVQEGTNPSTPSNTPLNAHQSVKTQETHNNIYGGVYQDLGFTDDHIAAINKEWDEQFARIANPLDGDVANAFGAGVSGQRHGGLGHAAFVSGSQGCGVTSGTGYDWAHLENIDATPPSSSRVPSISIPQSSRLSSKAQTPDTVVTTEAGTPDARLSSRSLRPLERNKPSATPSTVPNAAARPPPAPKNKPYRTSENAKAEARRQCGMDEADDRNPTGKGTLPLYIPVEEGGDDPDAPLPQGISLEEICRRFPNHLVGAGLDVFLQWRWSHIDIWNAVPEAIKRLWHKCGILGKSYDDPRFFLCKRLQNRRNALLKERAFGHLILGHKSHPSGKGLGGGVRNLDKFMKQEGWIQTEDDWVLGEAGPAAQVNPKKRRSAEVDQSGPAVPQHETKKAKTQLNATTATATLASTQPYQAVLAGQAYGGVGDESVPGNASHGKKRNREDDEVMSGKRMPLEEMPAVQTQPPEQPAQPLDHDNVLQDSDTLDLEGAQTAEIAHGGEPFDPLHDTSANLHDPGLFSGEEDGFCGGGLSFSDLLNADDANLQWMNELLISDNGGWDQTAPEERVTGIDTNQFDDVELDTNLFGASDPNEIEFGDGGSDFP